MERGETAGTVVMWAIILGAVFFGQKACTKHPTDLEVAQANASSALAEARAAHMKIDDLESRVDDLESRVSAIDHQ